MANNLFLGRHESLSCFTSSRKLPSCVAFPGKFLVSTMVDACLAGLPDPCRCRVSRCPWLVARGSVRRHGGANQFHGRHQLRRGTLFQRSHGPVVDLRHSKNPSNEKNRLLANQDLRHRLAHLRRIPVGQRRNRFRATPGPLAGSDRIWNPWRTHHETSIRTKPWVGRGGSLSPLSRFSFR